jgi:hypothetical protein
VVRILGSTSCFLAVGSAFATKQGGKVKIKGIITGHTGNALVVKTTDDNFTVVLSNYTKIRQPKGLIGAQKKQMSAADLIPGLKVTVEGVSDGEYRVSAKSVTFDANDLQTAEMVQAGVTPTEQKRTVNQQNIAVNKQNVDANKQTIEVNKQNIEAEQQNIAANKKSIEESQATINKGFAALAGDEPMAQATVHFEVGSTEISPEAREELKQRHTTLSAKRDISSK